MLSLDADRSWSNPLAAVAWIPGWAWAFALAGLVGVGVAAGSSQIYRVEHLATVERAQVAPDGGLPDEVGAWVSAPWWDTPHAAEATWVAARFDLSASDLDDRVLGLRLSGPFSAEVWLNGVRVGAKGTPALDPAGEVAGPIDASIRLGDAARPGRNDLLMFVSAHHAGYAPDGLFHWLDVTDHEADARRRLGSYWLAATQSGLLLAFVGVFLYARRFGEAGRSAYWAAAAAACLIAAFGFEVSRVVVNYAYTWHGERQFLIGVSAYAFGIAVNGYAAARYGVWRRGRLLWAAVLATPLLFWLAPGEGPRAAAGLAALLLAAGAGLVLHRRRRPGPALSLTAMFAAWIPFMLAANRDFFDNGIYALAPLAFAVMAADALARTVGERTADAAPPDESARLCLDGGLSWPVETIRAVHAAGNYAEIEFDDGARELVRVTLSAVADAAPAPLMRVHRSHLVNIVRARRLRVAPGSRYTLEMDDGGAVPVSRGLAAEVRKALA